MSPPHRRFPILSLLALVAVPSVHATSTEVILEDAFNSLAAWSDLSTAITWNGQPETGSVFEVVDGTVAINAAGLDVPMWGTGGIGSFSALDQRFPAAVDREGATITVEWRMRWQQLDNKGESNRVAFMLIHDYPEGGLDLTRDARVSDFEAAWWGRPAYQVRVRGGTNPPDAAPYLMYGGGREIEGEFERGDTPLRWLPGFVSGAGGSTPGTSPAAGWPGASWAMGLTAPASTSFRRFRWIVRPTVQELWVNRSDDGTTWELDLSMPLPLEADAPTTAPQYRWFSQVEGLRIYFRGPGTRAARNNTFLDSVRVTVEREAVTDPFIAWATDLPEGSRGPGDTPFGDGVPNRLRHALGLPAGPVDAAVLAAARPAPILSGAEVRFALRLLPQVEAQFQVATEPGAWLPVANLPGARVESAPDGDRTRYEVVLPAAGAAAFVRLVLD